MCWWWKINLSRFLYDFNRLTQATIAGVGTKTWRYDGLGNIFEKDGHVYTYDSARPHAVTSARGSTYVYDANGNMQMTYGAVSRFITWNSDNKPIIIWANNRTAEFSYTPEGARYRQVSTIGGMTTTTLYAGAHHEQVTVSGVTTHKDYLSAAGRVVAVRETTGGTVTMKYLHQDHLGSTDVVTDAGGQVLERMSFDAFGSRRSASSWNDPVAALIGLSSTRGFTGHEQLDGVGLIHMNGRVYDPALGRFLSADPLVGTPANPQNLNRYSYVNNNPLSYTDPSGYFLKSLKKLFRGIKNLFKNEVFRTVFAIVGSAFTFGHVGLLTSSPFWGAVAGGFVGGSIATGTLKGGLIGAFTAGAFYGVGSLAQAHKWGSIRRTLAHGVVGGGSSMASGGRFQSGFASAGFTQFASPVIGTAPGDVLGRTMATAVVGGTASELAGGKFANGAVTGAFSRLFNDQAHPDSDEDIFQGEEKVFRHTGNSRIEWEGLENVEWREAQIDGILELFVRRPLPPMSVQLGVEHGFRAYEFQEGIQAFQYRADSSSFGGNVAKTPIGPIQWTEKAVWQPIKGDTTVFTRHRFRACAAQSCY